MPTPEKSGRSPLIRDDDTSIAMYPTLCRESVYTLIALLKKDVPWIWDVDHQNSFDEWKHVVSTSSCLHYYDTTALVQLKVDASMT